MERIARTAVVILLLAVLGLFGLGFLSAAMFLALAQLMPHHVAALVCGSAFLIIALLLAVICGQKKGHSAAQNATMPLAPDLNRIAMQLGGDLARQASGYSRAHPWAAAGVSLACGALVGASPRLRGALLELLQSATKPAQAASNQTSGTQ